MSKKNKAKVRPEVWKSRMRVFLREQSRFTDEDQETCIQFIEKFVRQDLPTYLRAVDAIECYFHVTNTMADEATRKEHAKFANGIGHLANQIADVTHFSPDEDLTVG